MLQRVSVTLTIYALQQDIINIRKFKIIGQSCLKLLQAVPLCVNKASRRCFFVLPEKRQSLGSLQIALYLKLDLKYWSSKVVLFLRISLLKNEYKHKGPLIKSPK